MQTPLPDTSPFKGVSVLIVEDDSLQAMLLENAFMVEGCEDVRIASSMIEILSILRDDAPDILILDSGLSDSNEGWSVAELATALDTKEPLIFFVTGSPETVPEEIAALGKLVPKPVQPEKLLEIIKDKMLDRSASWAKARKIGRWSEAN